MKYLDNNGLLYVIQKIKTWLSGKVDKVDGKGLSTNDYTTNEKNKLAGLSNYTLPTASATTKGGVKIGTGLTMNGDVLSATGGGTADAVDWANVTNKPTKLTDFTNDLAYKTAYDASTNKIATESDLAIKTLVGTKNDPVVMTSLDSGLYKISGSYVGYPGANMMTVTEDKYFGVSKSLAETAIYMLTPTIDASNKRALLGTNLIYKEGDSYLTKEGVFTTFSDVETAITGKGYQTSSQVETAITSKGYQTASDVNSIITGKGYQTASDVETAITNKISSVMTYKGTVANYSDLPTNAKVGDTYNITNKSSHNKAGDNAAWNGTSWDILAGTIDLSGYYTKAEMEALTNDEIDGIFTAE